MTGIMHHDTEPMRQRTSLEMTGRRQGVQRGQTESLPALEPACHQTWCSPAAGTPYQMLCSMSTSWDLITLYLLLL